MTVAVPAFGKKKKRPGPFSQGRLGSPPPELPNHELDSRFRLTLCKRHFGNSISAELRRNLTEETAHKSLNESDLLFLPDLAGVGGSPDFGSRGGDLSVLWIREFDGDDVARQYGTCIEGNYARPVIAAVR
jgi:hypothetical protein